MTQSEFNHLLSQIKALPPEQARRLRQQLNHMPEPPARTSKRAAPKPGKPLTVAELHQKLLADGRISHLPDTTAVHDDPDDQPITIKGEPLSETIIRERR